MITTVDLADRLDNTGGFTVGFNRDDLSGMGETLTGDSTTGIADGPESGYVVSCDPDLTRVVTKAQTSGVLAATIALYLLDKGDALAAPGKYAGAWLDTETGKIHLDVVTVVDDRDKALELARTHDEIAVWHLDTATEIRTDSEVTA